MVLLISMVIFSVFVLNCHNLPIASTANDSPSQNDVQCFNRTLSTFYNSAFLPVMPLRKNLEVLNTEISVCTDPNIELHPVEMEFCIYVLNASRRICAFDLLKVPKGELTQNVHPCGKFEKLSEHFNDGSFLKALSVSRLFCDLICKTHSVLCEFFLWADTLQQQVTPGSVTTRGNTTHAANIAESKKSDVLKTYQLHANKTTQVKPQNQAQKHVVSQRKKDKGKTQGDKGGIPGNETMQGDQDHMFVSSGEAQPHYSSDLQMSTDNQQPSSIRDDSGKTTQATASPPSQEANQEHTNQWSVAESQVQLRDQGVSEDVIADAPSDDLRGSKPEQPQDNFVKKDKENSPNSEGKMPHDRMEQPGNKVPDNHLANSRARLPNPTEKSDTVSQKPANQQPDKLTGSNQQHPQGESGPANPGTNVGSNTKIIHPSENRKPNQTSTDHTTVLPVDDIQVLSSNTNNQKQLSKESANMVLVSAFEDTQHTKEAKIPSKSDDAATPGGNSAVKNEPITPKETPATLTKSEDEKLPQAIAKEELPDRHVPQSIMHDMEIRPDVDAEMPDYPMTKPDEGAFPDNSASPTLEQAMKTKPSMDSTKKQKVFPEEFTNPRPDDEFPVEEESHFFAYFLIIVTLCIVGYVAFHNKQKIIALVVEGRHQRRRRSNGGNYRRLDNNLADVMEGIKTGNSPHIIY